MKEKYKKMIRSNKGGIKMKRYMLILFFMLMTTGVYARYNSIPQFTNGTVTTANIIYSTTIPTLLGDNATQVTVENKDAANTLTFAMLNNAGTNTVSTANVLGGKSISFVFDSPLVKTVRVTSTTAGHTYQLMYQ